jgi:hypothetical protein
MTALPEGFRRRRLLRLALGALAAAAPLVAARGEPAPLFNPARLNIGLACQWQARCMSEQEHAMDHALKYVRKYRPAVWKVELCNRNASRNRSRVDWTGFNNCIRNSTLRPYAQRRKRRSVETASSR